MSVGDLKRDHAFLAEVVAKNPDGEGEPMLALFRAVVTLLEHELCARRGRALLEIPWTDAEKARGYKDIIPLTVGM